jgi:hypothetical protein
LLESLSKHTKSDTLSRFLASVDDTSPSALDLRYRHLLHEFPRDAGMLPDLTTRQLAWATIVLVVS